MTGSEHGPADAASRVTPYELVFGAPAFDETRFDVLRAQVESYGATRASELLLLPAAGELLHELLPGGEAEGTHRELVAQTGALLFHAFRSWLHGRAVYGIPEALLRPALQRERAVGEWRFRTPLPAGYVQLPHHLLWARVSDGAVPEPVDGFFWSAPAAEEAAAERLDLLLVLGVRRGRPGVSLVDLTVEGEPDLRHWADADARPDGTDFGNVLPGGELQGYHAVTTLAEALKLASLCFWLIDTEALTAAAPVPGAGGVVAPDEVHG
jgi:hypothetical protein